MTQEKIIKDLGNGRLDIDGDVLRQLIADAGWGVHGSIGDNGELILVITKKQ